MSDRSPEQPGKPQWIAPLAWTLQILVALVFFAAGGAKLAGVAQMVEVFDQIGMGQWFRYLTGALEVAGAALVLYPRAAFYGGAILACVMVGAVGAHLFVIGGNPAPAALLLIAATTIAALRRSQA